MSSNGKTRNFFPLNFLFFALIAVTILAGCKKATTGYDSTVVTISTEDINSDGSIADPGLKKIEAQGKAPSIMVTFGRNLVSDLALAQLAKFPNIRHVSAVRSPLSDEAIAALKAAIPQVEVRK